MRPFRLLLEHPAYWTLNRRNVTRAFALGLFISFVPLPVHILLATAAGARRSASISRQPSPARSSPIR